jgi:hypothetical protein
MSTWTSRLLAAAGLALALAGCDEAGFPVTSSDAAKPLTAATLSRGAVTLAVPQGYCIDPRSLRGRAPQGFALVARCDALGAEGWYRAQHLVLITVSTAPLRTPDFRATPDSVAKSAFPAEVLERRSVDGTALVLLRDMVPETEGVSPVHWRGAFTLGGHLVAMSLYAPEGSTALRANGAALLAELAATSRSATAARQAGKARLRPHRRHKGH